MTTTTETRPPFLKAILDEREPRSKVAQEGFYAVDTSRREDLYSVGFDGDGADVVSYHDVRMKKLQEFKETAEHQNPRILPDGSLVDEYSDGTTTLVSVKLANGYSYHATFPKNNFFDHEIGLNGDFITTDKKNGSSMRTTKVEGNRLYKDISNFSPSVTHVWSSVLESGRIGLQIQKDGRVAVAYTEGTIPSHSFFFKTQHGAILTCDDGGALILADSSRLPKEIGEQERAIHQQFASSGASLDTLVAPPVPLEQIRQERDQGTIAALGSSLKKHLASGSPDSKSQPHTSSVAQRGNSVNALG